MTSLNNGIYSISDTLNLSLIHICQTNKFDNDYFDDDDSDADYSDNDSIVEYEEAAEESDITKSTSEIQSNSDDLEEYLDD